ncbi:hypothetical protein EVAR_48842_1 [Eumeta japonica]|uniref:Uncharacterized protein n=1 Tax=Eumeta variegata TaxID=151549 RepID=A0A4C1YA73_EUMVA|nr:hypothetical protein EVAR_48842_1 [Eumeta japonica]
MVQLKETYAYTLDKANRHRWPATAGSPAIRDGCRPEAKVDIEVLQTIGDNGISDYVGAKVTSKNNELQIEEKEELEMLIRELFTIGEDLVCGYPWATVVMYLFPWWLV